MKRFSFFLSLVLLTLLVSRCDRPSTGKAGSPHQPSWGEALESSFASSETEQKARKALRDERKELQDREQKLQQDRLKSYGDTRAFDKTP